MIRKISIICGIILLFFILYFRFFIFSYDLDNGVLNLSEQKYYSDGYLEDIGFSKVNGPPEYESRLKRNKFSIEIDDEVFTDSLNLYLHTADFAKPFYLFYSIQMTPKVDSVFLSTINLELDNTTTFSEQENDKIPKIKQIDHFKQKSNLVIDRSPFFINDKLVKVRYRFMPLKPSDKNSSLKKMEVEIVSFLHRVF